MKDEKYIFRCRNKTENNAHTASVKEVAKWLIYLNWTYRIFAI